MSLRELARQCTRISLECLIKKLDSRYEEIKTLLLCCGKELMISFMFLNHLRTIFEWGEEGGNIRKKKGGRLWRGKGLEGENWERTVRGKLRRV